MFDEGLHRARRAR
ncbi:protein of unknown function (plasmid) [Azospirillum baldaniorum]|uniref:Uncharacterized protein n=1 Tax=Azospirillum baldaniorum TaxID=1064539 RepID=A0A9P1JVS2_9PROT|nr:protein of unknown function [Azospirillum baldaniorum]